MQQQLTQKSAEKIILTLFQRSAILPQITHPADAAALPPHSLQPDHEQTQGTNLFRMSYHKNALNFRKKLRASQCGKTRKIPNSAHSPLPSRLYCWPRSFTGSAACLPLGQPERVADYTASEEFHLALKICVMQLRTL